MTNFAEQIQKIYPDIRTHVHVEATRSGMNSYKITVTVVNGESEILHMLDYYASGDLNRLKEEALATLLASIAPA